MKLTNENFKEEVEDFKGVVLIDFWADWCMPCRMLTPVIEELEEDYKDNKKVKIAKLNVDENRETASKFNVMSIPTLIVFKDGNATGQIVGVQPKERIAEEIEKALED